MSLPDVAQAQALNSVMASALKAYRPDSNAVMGYTTGNGFEHIVISHTRRAIDVDINTAYLTASIKRFAERLPRLELAEGDVASGDFHVGPISMVFAELKLINSDTIPLKQGKAFFVGIYKKSAGEFQDGRQMWNEHKQR